jgi:hypothetical protein
MKKHNTEGQRAILLERLKEKPCTTVEARHELDIVAPAPRVHELRHDYGFNIKTFWTTALNPGGQKHRFAKYVLLAGKYKESK